MTHWSQCPSFFLSFLFRLARWCNWNHKHQNGQSITSKRFVG